MSRAPRGRRGWRARTARRTARGAAVVALGASLLAPALAAQAVAPDRPNFIMAPADLEDRLADDPFEIVGMADNRWEGDRTQRTALRFRDGTVVRVKWARAAPGGEDLNNQPRYEIAAYEIQKLFLDEREWVVPPTVMREMPLRVYRQLDPELGPTFEGTASVLVAVQYWLENVEPLVEPDPERMEDEEYLRRLGHLNLLTYLIRHVDSNHGNTLISTDGPPRMFAVDNGVAFRSPESPRGTFWRDLHTDRLPRGAIERIRAWTRAEVEDALAVVAQFRLRDDGRLEAIPATARTQPHRGVVFEDGIVQLGLTDMEIDGVWERRSTLLDRIDAGDITVF